MELHNTEKIGFVDSHVHFDLIVLDLKEMDVVINHALKNNVTKMVAVGGDVGANNFSLKLSELYPQNVHAAIGYNRYFIASEQSFALFQETVQARNVIAIGEIGLDYYRLTQPPHSQRVLFEKMLEMAIMYKKPIIVHSRMAKVDTISLLREYRKSGGINGVLHCFTEDLAFAEELISEGFFISFSGIVTFKNAKELREVVKSLPLNKLLIETDSPYLTPEPFRGEKNQPAMIQYVAETVAKIKEINIEQLNQTLLKNFADAFNPLHVKQPLNSHTSLQSEN
jgi:TatD DNase family protein